MAKGELPHFRSLIDLTDYDNLEYRINAEDSPQKKPMRYCEVCECMIPLNEWTMDEYRCDYCVWDALETEAYGEGDNDRNGENPG